LKWKQAALKWEKGGAEQFFKCYHGLFYPGFNFTVFEFKILFAVVYLHTIWTFTLKRRNSITKKSFTKKVKYVKFN
jgi:hypothetical protein